ncbi:MAG: hypothetical protein OJF59_001240 [Cytophagales bacterium]|nr:MAG: hypothetical protein OJF59_001240 [Cytophagales bacterium]
MYTIFTFTIYNLKKDGSFDISQTNGVINHLKKYNEGCEKLHA